MDEFSEFEEEIYKESRNLTRESKKRIFEVHRLYGFSRGSDEEVVFCKEMNERFERVKRQFSDLFSKGESDVHFFWRYHRKFHFCIHEYLESLLFRCFVECKRCSCSKGSCLLSPDSVRSSHWDSFGGVLEMCDYLPGLFDLSGELMRFATNLSISIHGCLGAERRRAEEEEAQLMDVALFLQKLDGFVSTAPFFERLSGVEKKKNDQCRKVLRQNVLKVERLLYSLKIKESHNNSK